MRKDYCGQARLTCMFLLGHEEEPFVVRHNAAGSVVAVFLRKVLYAALCGMCGKEHDEKEEISRMNRVVIC